MDLIKKTKILLPVTSENQPDWKKVEYFVNNSIIPHLTSRAKSIFCRNFDNKPAQSKLIDLNSINWRWFKIFEIFSQLEKCKCGSASELLEDGDDIAYIGAKKNDNGIMRTVKTNIELVTKGNCIVFIGDGQGSVGYCLYQPNDFIGSTTLVAGYNKHLNKYNAQFLITILDKERYRYSFGRKYNKTAISNTKIKLPTTSEGKPNWQFMEDYIKRLPYSANL